LADQHIGVLVIAPDAEVAVKQYWQRHQLPFDVVADSAGRVLKILGQQTSVWKMGRMPALLAVNHDGQVVYEHAGRNMRDLPNWQKAIEALSNRKHPTDHTPG
jgi:peroxiredoxin